MPMTIEEFRDEMRRFRDGADRDASLAKDPMSACLELVRLYTSFDAQERSMADIVLSEWLASPDSSVRYDAMYLIGEFHNSSCLPAMHDLSLRLSSIPGPEAYYERVKVNRRIAELRQKESPSP